MPLPPAVEALVAGRLSAVDAAVPGLVTALWVTGSAASGDWRPGRSDVDFVAATDRPPGPADVAALAAVHAAAGLPHFDGLYVPAAALADPPMAGEAVPHVVGGGWDTGPCGECTPVTWLELRQRGVAVRGPAPAHAQLAARCVAWRAGAPEAFDTADGLAAAALVREVVASAGAGPRGRRRRSIGAGGRGEPAQQVCRPSDTYWLGVE